MSNFSFQEYADIIYIYGFCDGNSRRSEEEYSRRFPNRRAPSRRVFQDTFNRLRETGTVRNRREREPTQESTGQDNVLSLVRNSPNISVRRISSMLNIPRTTAWKILNKNKFHPYHFQPVQELLAGDKIVRLNFCRWMQHKDISHMGFISQILWTDESQFTRDGCFNFHNEHTWARENPHRTRANSSQYKFSVNVWAGIISNYIVGPFIFETSLNSNIYLNFLNQELGNFMDDIPLLNRTNMYFQHDGAPPHYAINVKQWLDQHFPNRWIGRNGPIRWPPRSPDITPLDFYLWGRMKNLVYAEEIRSREHLLIRINQAVLIVRQELSTSINLKLQIRKRINICIQNEGDYFENFL